MPLTSKLIVEASAKLDATQDLGSAVANALKSISVSLANGTAAGQADKLFADSRTLAASATEDLDLSGVLTDPLGNTLTFAKVKGLLIAADAGNTNNVIVGAAGVNPWVGLLNATGTVTLRPGAAALFVAGAADATAYVAASPADLIKVANSGAGSTVTYHVVIIGTGA